MTITIVTTPVYELGNTILKKKLYKKTGHGSKYVVGKNEVGRRRVKEISTCIFLPIEVNTGPAIDNYNVIASQEPSEKNEKDEALNRPMNKKKIEHVTTNNDLCLDEKEENNDDLKRKQVDGLEVITGSINHLNNEFCSDAVVFAAGALSGAAAKTVTAPTHGLRVGQESAKKAIGFVHLKKLGIGSKYVVGKNEVGRRRVKEISTGIFLPIEVNTGPAIDNYNVIASQEPSEENEKDEALSRHMNK
nr:probable envelope ADP,ATP carrier protein, chloroplastic [Tanacetum cinerariifolium]